jgi:hypothetical protein
MSKYRITEHHITQQGGIEKLKRDGYSRSEIMQKMYKVTEGASQNERTKIVSELFNKG